MTAPGWRHNAACSTCYTSQPDGLKALPPPAMLLQLPRQLMLHAGVVPSGAEPAVAAAAAVLHLVVAMVVVDLVMTPARSCSPFSSSLMQGPPHMTRTTATTHPWLLLCSTCCSCSRVPQGCLTWLQAQASWAWQQQQQWGSRAVSSWWMYQQGCWHRPKPSMQPLQSGRHRHQVQQHHHHQQSHQQQLPQHPQASQQCTSCRGT